MNRIPLSEKIRKQINKIMQSDQETEEDLITKLLHIEAQHIAQKVLKQEVTDYLSRDRYEHHGANQEHRDYRNGYRRAVMDTVEGRVPLQVPQAWEFPEPYRSKLIEFLWGSSDVLEHLAVEM